MIIEKYYKKKYEYMFDKFTSGIIIINEFRRIEELNQQAAIQLGLSQNQLINQSFTELINILTITPADIFSIKKGLTEKGYHELDTSLSSGGGLCKYLTVHIHKITEENKYFIQLADCTEKLSLQQKLAQAESLTNLGELAASIAHEIRNPMTSLKGFTQLMLSETNDRGTKYLQVIQQEIDRIDKILNEFLMLSKPKQYTLETINLQQLVMDVVDFMSPQALLYGVELKRIHRTSVEKIYADPITMKQLLINSIKNAIEAMQDGGTITVVVDSRDNEIEISIHDEGTGVDLTNLEQYFQVFYTTKESGTGLGLAHAARVMEDMKGRVEVSNNLAGGASFYFYFPILLANTF